jgi:hypothetical protein
MEQILQVQLLKNKEALKKLLQIKSDNLLKEIVFISKHHGDVAQSLVKFRDVQMKCPLPPDTPDKTINTADYKATFVSIDVNAIIKALTIETPIILMYPPDKETIIVWKNTNLENPTAQFEYEKKFTEEMQKRLLEKVEKYEQDNLTININQAMFNAKRDISLKLLPQDVPAGRPFAEYATMYQDTLKTAVHITTLIRYIPEKPLNPLTEAQKSNF